MFIPNVPKCVKCGDAATHKFTRFVNGKPKDVYYCDEHAASSSPYIKAQNPQLASPEMLKELFKDVFAGIEESGAFPGEAVPSIKCDSCGLAFETYKRTLLLGCADCYRFFEKQLVAELRKFHGETTHKGRSAAEGAPLAPEPHLPAVSLPEEAAAHVASAPEIMAAESEAPEPKIEAPKVEEGNTEELRSRLKEAVTREDFDEAARLRDRIQEIEQHKVS